MDFYIDVIGVDIPELAVGVEINGGCAGNNFSHFVFSIIVPILFTKNWRVGTLQDSSLQDVLKCGHDPRP